MSFSTQDCKDLLVKIFNKTSDKDWKRIKKSNANGIVTRTFSHQSAGKILIKEENNQLIYEPSKDIPISRSFTDKELEIGRKILHSYVTGSEYNHKGKLIVERDENESGNYEFSADVSLILSNPLFVKHLYCIAPFFSFTFPEDVYANDPAPSFFDEKRSTRYNDFYCFYLLDENGEIEMNGAELIQEFFPIHLCMLDEAHFNPDDDFPFDVASGRLMYNTLISSGFRHNRSECIFAKFKDGSHVEDEEDE